MLRQRAVAGAGHIRYVLIDSPTQGGREMELAALSPVACKDLPRLAACADHLIDLRLSLIHI
eukprot:5061161-Alexandrium_andersonii.AAC.1